MLDNFISRCYVEISNVNVYIETNFKFRTHYRISMAATIKQIAEQAKLSIATVSRALSDDQKVRSETKQLVLKIAKELKYKPNLIARNFVKRKSNIIGLILPDISDEFFSEIIRGVDETSYKHGYYTMVISSHKNRSLGESVHAMMGSGIVGGFIMLVPFFDKEIKNALSHERVPFVIISGDSEIGDYNIVSIDNYKAAYELTEHLIKNRGYKKIAHFTGPLDNNDAILRKKGFYDACKNNGIDVKKNWVINGDFTKESGEAAALKIIGQKSKPEVIFAANDMMALGCYNALANSGLKIPRDMGVAGFDDILISRHLNPPLTTVKVHIDELGTIASKILINKMNGENHSVSQKIKVATELVIRKSC